MPDDNSSGSTGHVERGAPRFRLRDSGLLSAVSNHEQPKSSGIEPRTRRSRTTPRRCGASLGDDVSVAVGYLPLAFLETVYLRSPQGVAAWLSVD